MPQSKQNLFGFVSALGQNAKKHSLNLLLASIIAGVFTLIILTGFFAGYYALIGASTPETILGIRATYLIVNYLLILVLASIVQIITLKIFFEPTLKISRVAGNIKTYFWKVLILTIVSSVLFFLCSLPVYVAIILFIAQNYLLSLLAMLIGILLLLLFTSYIMFSPFIIIEKKNSVYEALTESMALTSKNIWGVFIKLIALIVIMVLVNYLVSFFITAPYVGFFIDLAAMIVFFGFLIIYLFTIYQDLKTA